MDDVPVAHLQRLVLEALLGARPLPGATRPLTLPDAAAFLPRGEAAPLAPDNLADPSALPAGVRVLRAPGESAHLRFGAPERVGDAVCMTLELRLGPGALSGTRVRFKERDGRWTAAGEPVMYAS